MSKNKSSRLVKDEALRLGFENPKPRINILPVTSKSNPKKTWSAKGRVPRKGEKAIRVTNPKTGRLGAPLFHISQTVKV